MRVFVELCRIGLAGVAHSVGRRFTDLGDRILEPAVGPPWDLAEELPDVEPEDSLLSDAAAAMMAGSTLAPVIDDPPPLKGSLAERSAEVNRQWAR